jgi:hypothetical protein
MNDSVPELCPRQIFAHLTTFARSTYDYTFLVDRLSSSLPDTTMLAFISVNLPSTLWCAYFLRAVNSGLAISRDGIFLSKVKAPCP